MNNPDPQGLLQEIEKLKHILGELGSDYSNARHQQAAMEQAYEKEIAKIYISLLDPKEREKMGLEKLPAEDMRKAIAHSKMDENTWSAYLMTEADVDSLAKKIKITESVLTGCQAQLNQLRVEMSHA
jgi:hypothetical protein